MWATVVAFALVVAVILATLVLLLVHIFRRSTSGECTNTTLEFCDPDDFARLCNHKVRDGDCDQACDIFVNDGTSLADYPYCFWRYPQQSACFKEGFFSPACESVESKFYCQNAGSQCDAICESEMDRAQKIVDDETHRDPSAFRFCDHQACDTTSWLCGGCQRYPWNSEECIIDKMSQLDFCNGQEDGCKSVCANKTCDHYECERRNLCNTCFSRGFGGDKCMNNLDYARAYCSENAQECFEYCEAGNCDHIYCREIYGKACADYVPQRETNLPMFAALMACPIPMGEDRDGNSVFLSETPATTRSLIYNTYRPDGAFGSNVLKLSADLENLPKADWIAPVAILEQGQVLVLMTRAFIRAYRIQAFELVPLGSPWVINKSTDLWQRVYVGYSGGRIVYANPRSAAPELVYISMSAEYKFSLQRVVDLKTQPARNAFLLNGNLNNIVYLMRGGDPFEGLRTPVDMFTTTQGTVAQHTFEAFPTSLIGGILSQSENQLMLPAMYNTVIYAVLYQNIETIGVVDLRIFCRVPNTETYIYARPENPMRLYLGKYTAPLTFDDIWSVDIRYQSQRIERVVCDHQTAIVTLKWPSELDSQLGLSVILPI